MKGIPTTAKNPQAKLVEHIYKILDKIIYLHDIENKILDPKDPFMDILHTCIQAIRSTIYIILKKILGQLVFGYGMIFYLSFKAKQKEILDNKKTDYS